MSLRDRWEHTEVDIGLDLKDLEDGGFNGVEMSADLKEKAKGIEVFAAHCTGLYR